MTWNIKSRKSRHKIRAETGKNIPEWLLSGPDISDEGHSLCWQNEAATSRRFSHTRPRLETHQQACCNNLEIKQSFSDFCFYYKPETQIHFAERPVQAQHRVSIMSSFKILKVPIVKINQPISQCCGIEYLTKETKEEPGILYSPPISDCLHTENRLFPNKTTLWAHRSSPASRFKNFTANSAQVQAPPHTFVEILYCSSHRLNLKPSKFSNFVLS